LVQAQNLIVITKNIFYDLMNKCAVFDNERVVFGYNRVGASGVLNTFMDTKNMFIIFVFWVL
jgi:hypothetical protein